MKPKYGFNLLTGDLLTSVPDTLGGWHARGSTGFKSTVDNLATMTTTHILPGVKTRTLSNPRCE